MRIVMIWIISIGLATPGFSTPEQEWTGPAEKGDGMNVISADRR
jgi:hypothetical protein